MPSEVIAKVKAWQDAHRAYVLASKTYSDTRATEPFNLAECERCRIAMQEAAKDVPPAREAMMMALWRI